MPQRTSNWFVTQNCRQFQPFDRGRNFDLVLSYDLEKEGERLVGVRYFVLRSERLLPFRNVSSPTYLVMAILNFLHDHHPSPPSDQKGSPVVFETSEEL
eukprot:scaffold4001_cov94-Cylindrotheca_fusiformis.AAC.6